ncbi:MAG: 23S rRNA (uracil(1939)-C(5))-methyltransferase RlmD [Erysipelotrichaceae bacterium]|jgi:23S rRNA (uracil1939-C5)-methyltransferase|nr:23S rRNA (uracil(1939)-C(5))-methyltransferase RlmD [Erysipelotrichaceae bacterium]
MKMKIVKTGINGEGIGYMDKLPVFVPDVLADEEVDVKITKKERRYALGKAVRILSKNKDRIQPKCYVQKSCGACPLMIARYPKQLEYKYEILRQSLIKYAQIDPRLIAKPVANEHIFGYRNQCKLPCRSEDGRLMTGMFVPGSNYFHAIETCIIHEPGLENMRKAVLHILNKYRMPAYDVKKKKGIRSLVIRGFDGRYQCTLVTGEDELPDSMLSELCRLKGMHSLWQSIHTSRKSLDVFGSRMIHLGNETYLPLQLDDLQLQISPRSFFQLNTSQAKVLYRTIADMVGGRKKLIVEAYSGIGAISLYLRNKAERIIGIESIKDAVVNANRNAKLNHSDHVHFLCADAADKLLYLSKKETIDVLIVDPPRTGLDDAMLACILQSRIREMVYVSCNPATLGKDLGVLQKRYQVKKIVPIDMFSHTPHIESVCVLNRR